MLGSKITLRLRNTPRRSKIFKRVKSSILFLNESLEMQNGLSGGILRLRKQVSRKPETRTRVKSSIFTKNESIGTQKHKSISFDGVKVASHKKRKHNGRT